MVSIGCRVLVVLWLSWSQTSPAMAEVDIFASDLRVDLEPIQQGAVSLNCPKSGNDLITITYQNRLSVMNRYTVQYENDVALIVSSEISFPEEPFQDAYRFDVRSLDDPTMLGDVLSFMDKGNALLNEVCNGSPEAKQQFRELLDSNLSILGLSPEDYPSDF